MTRTLAVVHAGLGTPSSTKLLADQLAGAVSTQIGARGEAAAVTTIEVRDLAAGLAAAVTGGLPGPDVRSALDTVATADGLIAVTPVFAAGYSGLFKLFFDVLNPGALAGTPVLIAATAGTPRHSLVLDYAMRPLFTYLHAPVVPTGVFAATEDFGGAGSPALAERISRAAAELAAQMVGVGGVAGFAPAPAERERGGSVLAPPGEVASFEDLLRGHTG